jgi:quercetin dioxygenase-like cupin family protein
MTAQLAVFRACEASPLDETHAMSADFSPAAVAGTTMLNDAGMARGYSLRMLFQSPETNGFSLAHAWFKKNFPLPPHSHDCDCVYYVVSGELVFGKGIAKQVLRAGDGLYIPAGVMYGYTAGPDGVEILEFRSVSKFNIRMADQTPSLWSAMAAIVAENTEEWKVAAAPQRHGLGVPASGSTKTT